ncbi:MAG: DUF6273 domain-containing protein [Tannerella sp.]|jgi:hypothetical protein|nr:DUF6273 domain-containing protein [Tannerella sp.]
MTKDGKLIELNFTLPEMDIKGLHFNETKAKAFFELKNDGYYSRDILFLSARQMDEQESGDILSEYLETIEFRTAIFDALPSDLKPENTSCIKAFLPERKEGVKRYNGVTWWYWLRPAYSGSASNFCIVNTLGHTHYNIASSVGGCAPAFCVEKQH